MFPYAFELHNLPGDELREDKATAGESSAFLRWTYGIGFYGFSLHSNFLKDYLICPVMKTCI
jgi:hypothetical protein